MAVNVCNWKTWLEMAGNRWKWMEMDGRAGNGWKLMKMAGNGFILRWIARNC